MEFKIRLNNPHDGFRVINIKPSKGAAGHLVRVVRSGLTEGFSSFQIRIIGDKTVLFPNQCVPVAGVIKYFEEENSCEFFPQKSIGQRAYAEQIGLLNPYNNPSAIRTDQFLDKIWAFDKDNHYDIVSGIVSSLRQSIELGQGMLNGLELCLNEVSDNVLVHSGFLEDNREPTGFMMAQVHRSQNRVAIAVYDNGIGIPASLARGGQEFANPAKALELAIKKGVTDGTGVGNGLWLLDSIVRQNRGSLEMASGGARYHLRHLEAEGVIQPDIAFSKAASVFDGTTLVDFQLDFSQKVELGSIMPHNYTDLWMEAHEDDACGSNGYRIDIASESNGLGSRYDASKLRTLILNVASEVDGRIILDFANVDLVSMSFADELVRKLICEYGLLQFMEKFQFKNVNEDCVLLINAVIATESI